MPISIRCPHCRKSGKVPDDAAGKVAKCPACAGAFTVPDAKPPMALPDEDEKPVLTEQTAKKWKLMQAVGGLIALIGGVMSAFGYTQIPRGELMLLILGLLVMLLGMGLFIAGQVLGWWHHG